MISTQLSDYEVELLSSLVRQLIELVSDGEPEELTPAPDLADPLLGRGQPFTLDEQAAWGPVVLVRSLVAQFAYPLPNALRITHNFAL